MFRLVEGGRVTRSFDWPCAVTINGVEHPESVFGTDAGVALGILPAREDPVPHDPATQISTPDTIIRQGEVVYTAVISDKPLEDARKAVNAEIRAWRDEREFDPFLHDGKWFKGDADSIRRINGAMAMAQAALAISAPFSETWSTFTGAAYPVASAQAMLALGLAKGLAFSAVFAGSRDALAALATASSTAAMRDILAAFKAAHPAPVLLGATDYERAQVRTNNFTRDVPVGQRFIDLDA